MPAQTLIVVDDHHINRLLPCMLLKQAGHQVFECASGEEALQLMELYPVDQVLLDVALPSMSGVEVCQQIKRQPRFAHVKVIAYTAHGLAHEIQQFHAAGFDAVLVKPVQSRDILGLVDGPATDPS